MTEYTEDQIKEIVKKAQDEARKDQAVFEQYRMAKDSAYRIGLVAIKDSVNRKIIDPEVYRVEANDYAEFKKQFFPQPNSIPEPKQESVDDDDRQD